MGPMATNWTRLLDRALDLSPSQDEVPIVMMIAIPSSLHPTLMAIAQHNGEQPADVAGRIVARQVARWARRRSASATAIGPGAGLLVRSSAK